MKHLLKEYLETILGDYECIEGLLNDLNLDEKREYVKQYIQILSEFNKSSISLSTQEIIENILTYPNHIITALISDISSYGQFINRIGSTRRTNCVLSILSQNNGTMSMYKAFSKVFKAENFSHEAISSSLSQTMKILYTYKFILTQEILKKRDGNNYFLKDPRFLTIVEQIKQNQQYEISNEDVIRVIRNGIAHCNFKDSSITTDCVKINELEQNMQIIIFNITRDKFLLLDFDLVIKLMDYCQTFTNESFKNLLIQYTNIFDPSIPKERQKFAANEIFELWVDKGNLENFQLNALNKFIEKQPEIAYSINGIYFFAMALNYPEYYTISDIDRALNVIKTLNTSRNKQQKTSLLNDETLSINTLIITRMFDLLSTIKDLDLIKDFVAENMENPNLAKIATFKMEQNPKKKSVVNKFRLLRNCLAHSYIYDYGQSFQAFDIDENKQKIDLGEIDYHDFTMLCEDVENFIIDYYEKKIQQNPILTTANTEKLDE